jgi:hypothetical protein
MSDKRLQMDLLVLACYLLSALRILLPLSAVYRLLCVTWLATIDDLDWCSCLNFSLLLLSSLPSIMCSLTISCKQPYVVTSTQQLRHEYQRQPTTPPPSLAARDTGLYCGVHQRVTCNYKRLSIITTITTNITTGIASSRENEG